MADVGCGKLRHFDSFFRLTRQLVLVDTENQLSNPHVDNGQEYTCTTLLVSFPHPKRKCWHYQRTDLRTHDLRWMLSFVYRIRCRIKIH